jgi:hypothetical protein
MLASSLGLGYGVMLTPNSELSGKSSVERHLGLRVYNSVYNVKVPESKEKERKDGRVIGFIRCFFRKNNGDTVKPSGSGVSTRRKLFSPDPFPSIRGSTEIQARAT